MTDIMCSIRGCKTTRTFTTLDTTIRGYLVFERFRHMRRTPVLPRWKRCAQSTLTISTSVLLVCRPVFVLIVCGLLGLMLCMRQSLRVVFLRFCSLAFLLPQEWLFMIMHVISRRFAILVRVIFSGILALSLTSCISLTINTALQYLTSICTGI